MRRVALALAFGFALSTVPAAEPAKIADLIEKLGSPDFRTREQAGKDLDAIGEPALKALRAAADRADDAETAERAKTIADRIARRLANQAVIAPSLVALAGPEREVRDNLGDLERQSKYRVTLTDAAALGKKVAVDTGGKVPFWAAVGKLCDAAGLEVSPTRVGSEIALRPRAGIAPPACVSGAARVSAVPFPAAALPTVPATDIPLVLQLDLEPRLVWNAITGVRVSKVTDADGRELTGVAGDGKMPVAVREIPGGSIVIDPNGGVNLIPGKKPVGTGNVGFAPNATQALARLTRPPEGPAPTRLKLVEGVVRGAVWVGPGEIATVALGAKPALAGGRNGVSLTAHAAAVKGAKTYTVSVAQMFDKARVRTFDPRQGVDKYGHVVKPDGATDANGRAIDGIAVFDADGNPFDLAADYQPQAIQRPVPGPNGLEVAVSYEWTLTATPSKADGGPPAKLTLTGSWLQEVEIPFRLADVPVAVGTGK